MRMIKVVLHHRNFLPNGKALVYFETTLVEVRRDADDVPYVKLGDVWLAMPDPNEQGDVVIEIEYNADRVRS